MGKARAQEACPYKPVRRACLLGMKNIAKPSPVITIPQVGGAQALSLSSYRTSMNKITRIAALLLLGLVHDIHADRGGISFRPNVQLFEPNQNAFICWNRDEEILVLSTNLQASEPTKVLEVTVFPSEPKVTKGDIGVFKKATDIINHHLAYMSSASSASTRSANAGGSGKIFIQPAGEITFQEKIGAHDIAVVRVVKVSGFVDWVNDYLHKAGVENPTIPEPLRKTVEEYLSEGYGWFSFDVVSLDTKVKTNDAIQYRFNTKELYYPLRISRGGIGNTDIRLLVVSPGMLDDFRGLPMDRVVLQHVAVDITNNEMGSISEEMQKMLIDHGPLKIRNWKISGDLSSFDKDLLAK